MGNRGKTWRNKEIIRPITVIIIIIMLSILVAMFYYLIDYLRSILVPLVVYRLAIAFAFLSGVIASMIYYYLGRRWLRLEVPEIIFGFIYILSMTSLFTTIFFIDDIELAFQAAQIMATIFFGGLMIAVLMFINIKMSTQRTATAQPPQANPPPQPSPVQPQTLSHTSLFPLPQPASRS